MAGRPPSVISRGDRDQPAGHGVVSRLAAGEAGHALQALLLEAVTGSAFSEQRYEIHHMVTEGDMVAVQITHHGRHTGEFMGIPPTNRTFAYRHVHLLRFEDGRSVEHWAVRDDANLLRQLQAAEATAS